MHLLCNLTKVKEECKQSTSFQSGLAHDVTHALQVNAVCTYMVLCQERWPGHTTQM
jgi:hypothetical protein